MKRTGTYLCLVAALFLLALLTAGCMGKTPLHGTVDVDVTDSSNLEYTHVYITVTKVEFHPSADAGIDSSGWQTVDISSHPVTVDLAQLANGTLYADTTSDGKPLFSSTSLPADTYRQIRLHLAPTFDAAPVASARALGLSYNNEATFEDGRTAPIRIPNSAEGIKIVPEAPLVVTAGKHSRLALDFNLMDDMIDTYPNGVVECILTPRLGYFDMDAVGAIKGRLAYANLSSAYVVVLAQQAVPGKQCRVVRRATTVDPVTGVFNLYPLQVFGNHTTAAYDLLLRGENTQTAIVKTVTVHKGAGPAGATDLGTIVLNTGSEFEAQLLNPYQTSGAWVTFYQSLTTDPVPYEVHSYHLNPYTGKFTYLARLSSEAVQVYDFSSGSLNGPVLDPTTTPAAFSAVSAAMLSPPTAGVNVAGAAGATVTFTPNPL